jgi:Skp family chaperone for outer membrane proteins
MKFKVLYILAIVGLMSFTSNAQRVSGARIGYIDTEYILQNVPDYKEATSQLEVKLTKWKSEIEKRLADLETKKKALENEKVLLTKELYEERLEDISFEESEVLDYQQKRFGPGGDMVIQRTQLIQPVQDQIFAAVKEIAENKKYDFVFDKNADFLMLYSAERFDISEQVLKIITRASNREQAESKRERRELEKEKAVPEINSTKDERAQALEERKAQRIADLEQKRLEREKALEERRAKQKADREAKKKAAAERRQKALDTRSKTEKTVDSTATKTTAKGDAVVKADTTKVKTKQQLSEEKRKKALEEREARKKALEERKKKILEQRKKAREERLEQIRKNDSIRKAKKNDDN